MSTLREKILQSDDKSMRRLLRNSFFLNVLIFVIVMSSAMLVVGLPTGRPYSDPVSKIPISEVEQLLSIPDENIQYHLVDNYGVSMDTLKVIADPREGYLAVYSNVQTVLLGWSSNLFDWDEVKVISTRGTNPTIARAPAPDGGMIIGYEKWLSAGSSELSFQYYRDIDSLIGSDPPDRSIDIPRSLSPCNEGTPNIYSVNFSPDVEHSVIDVGFHFHLPDGSGTCVTSQADREGRGILRNFHGWVKKPHPDKSLNNLCSNAKLYTCGGRDAFIYKGKQYVLVEGWMQQNNWSAWRIYLYDGHSLAKLPLVASNGTESFGNPRISGILLPNGKSALIVCLFGFDAGGPLVYYKELPK